MVRNLQDVGWVLLIGLLLPLWMLVGLLGISVIIVRHLYLWTRGNTPANSRPRRVRRVVPAPSRS